MMDPMNVRIVELLQEDGRRPTTDLAVELRRSESTVRDRVRQLESRGVISGYGARINFERAGLSGKALVRAKVDYQRLSEVARALAGKPHVSSVYHTSGGAPLTFTVVAPSLQALETLLAKDVEELELRDVEMDIVLSTFAESKPVSLTHALERRAVVPATPPARVAARVLRP